MFVVVSAFGRCLRRSDGSHHLCPRTIVDKSGKVPNVIKACWRSFPLSLSCDKACSIFRIGRVSLSVFLPGKMSHRKAVALDGPPTFRRPMWPGFYRHHLIGLVGVVVGHFPSLSHDHPLVLVDETPDQAGERLMLGSRFASSEKVFELDFCRRFAGKRVSFV